MENELVTITSFLLAKKDLFSILKISLDTFLNFIEKIQKGYKDVTYHNKTHGADLAQTFYYYSTSCGLREKVKMSNLDLMCLLVAGGCHDHEHPGFNNVYLVETKDNLALRYNDVSVLENHHVASSFMVIVIFIGSILGTDMSKHFAELGKFKARLASPDFDPTGNDKDLVMFELFHFADISNSAKPWELCLKWTELLFIEFFHQGDLERNRGVPISYLMDRTVVNIAKSQIGFLDVIIIPSFTAASQVVNLEQNLQNLELNKTTWQSRFEEYEDRMNQEKQNLIQNNINNTKRPSVKIAFQ